MDLRSLLIVWLPLFLLLIFLILIVAMFISLARQGDERRRMIVQTASANTFSSLLLYRRHRSLSRAGRTHRENEPHRHPDGHLDHLQHRAVLLQTEVR